MTKKITTVAIAATIKFADLIRSNPEKLRPLYHAWVSMRVASGKEHTTSLDFSSWIYMVSSLTEQVCEGLVRESDLAHRFFFEETANMRVHVEVLGNGSKQYPFETECRPMVVPHGY